MLGQSIRGYVRLGQVRSCYVNLFHVIYVRQVWDILCQVMLCEILSG